MREEIRLLQTQPSPTNLIGGKKERERERKPCLGCERTKLMHFYYRCYFYSASRSKLTSHTVKTAIHHPWREKSARHFFEVSAEESLVPPFPSPPSSNSVTTEKSAIRAIHLPWSLFFSHPVSLLINLSGG